MVIKPVYVIESSSSGDLAEGMMVSGSAASELLRSVLLVPESVLWVGCQTVARDAWRG